LAVHTVAEVLERLPSWLGLARPFFGSVTIRYSGRLTLVTVEKSYKPEELPPLGTEVVAEP
jgi:hypothetical protein